MKLAVISDIHSNIYALEKVWEDIRKKNIGIAVCLGDLVGYCVYPNEVINLIREKSILTIMGNYDEAVGNEEMACGCNYSNPKDLENAAFSLNWTIDNTSEENKKFLRELPKQMVLNICGRNITFVHGSPRKINEYLKQDSKEADEVMKEFEGDILVCGHTHIPYSKTYGNKLLVNSGSVGKSKTGNPKSNYVIMDINEDSVIVEKVEVEYDFEKTAKAIEEKGLPKEFAEIIRTGRA